MTTPRPPRHAAACLTFVLLSLAAALAGCERRATDPQAPSTTAPSADAPTPPSTAPAEPAMPPASAASQ